jgi:hypothetical protein
VITLDIIRFLLALARSHKRTDLHGVVMDGDMPTLRVMTRKEEKKNRALA